MDRVLSSQVGHILVTFALINENCSSFARSELDPDNFKSYLIKLMQI